MTKNRKWIQILALIIFTMLLYLGKVQIWMFVFFGSLLLSIFFGRFYCGYLCPINTVMEFIDNRAKKKNRQRKKTPNWMKNPIIRVIVLIIFIGLMIIVFIKGKKFPVLPILFALGVILTIFFEPSLWHRYLCPYGALLSIFSKRNKKGYDIHEEDCIKCGICVKKCPSDAISWVSKKEFPYIEKNSCLVCGKCEENCPKDAINYM